MFPNVTFCHTERTSHHNLRAVSEAKPTVSSNEVLVQIRSVSLNYRDLAVSDSTYLIPVKNSVVPCSDGVGVVVGVGAGVEGFQRGDRVITNFDLTNLYGPQLDWARSLGGMLVGVLHQYIALPAHVLTNMPKDSKLSFVQMASRYGYLRVQEKHSAVRAQDAQVRTRGCGGGIRLPQVGHHISKVDISIEDKTYKA